MSARQIGLAGSLLGVAAGITQATIGSRIPEWSGSKQAPLALGLLTVALSLAAALAAVSQSRRGLSARARAGCAVALVGPGLLCLSTVGRLGYLPAVLLVIAGVQTIHSWRDTAAAVATGWSQILLGALGCCELLMAAGSAPVPMVIGAVGGLSLVAAACLNDRRRWVLVAIDTVPFAVVGWTAIVPLLLAVEAIALSVRKKPS